MLRAALPLFLLMALVPASPSRADTAGATAAGTLLALPAAATQTIKLRFAWPKDLSAQVQYEEYREDHGRRQPGSTLTCRLSVEPRGGSLAVSHLDWKEPGGAEAGVAFRVAAALVTVLDPSGKAVKVEGFAQAREILLRSHEPPFDVDPSAPEMRQWLDVFLTTESGKYLGEQWPAQMGLWAGQELALGEEKVLAGEVPLGTLPGMRLPIHTRLQALRLAPCPARPGQCVELRSVSGPDPEDLNQAVEALMARKGVDRESAERVIEANSVSLKVRALAEVATLVPHRVELMKSAAVRQGKPGEGPSRVDVKVFRYAYAATR